MSIKSDCFAYHHQKKMCIALEDLYCRKEDTCAFYKNIAQYQEAERQEIKGYKPTMKALYSDSVESFRVRNTQS